MKVWNYYEFLLDLFYNMWMGCFSFHFYQIRVFNRMLIKVYNVSYIEICIAELYCNLYCEQCQEHEIKEIHLILIVDIKTLLLHPHTLIKGYNVPMAFIFSIGIFAA